MPDVARDPRRVTPTVSVGSKRTLELPEVNFLNGFARSRCAKISTQVKWRESTGCRRSPVPVAFANPQILSGADRPGRTVCRAARARRALASQVFFSLVGAGSVLGSAHARRSSRPSTYGRAAVVDRHDVGSPGFGARPCGGRKRASGDLLGAERGRILHVSYEFRRPTFALSFERRFPASFARTARRFASLPLPNLLSRIAVESFGS